MLSNSLMTSLVATGTVALATWLGFTVNGIFQDTAALLEEIQVNPNSSHVKTLTEEQTQRLQDFGPIVSSLTSK